MEAALNILYLENDPLQVKLVADKLAEEGLVNDVVRVENRGDFVAALERGEFDLILADYLLPKFDAISALAMARGIFPYIPFIVVSGRIGEEKTVEALKAGVSDYVPKDNIALLVRAVRSAQSEAAGRERIKKTEALRDYIDITERKKAQEELRQSKDLLEKRVAERTEELARAIKTLHEEIAERIKIEDALRKSEERYASAVLGANDGIWDWDFESGEAYVSPRWKNMLGYGEDEIQDIVTEWKGLIHPDDYASAMEHLEAYLAGHIPEYRLEYRMRHRDGSYRWILTRGICFRDDNGKPFRMAGSHTDITEHKDDEEKIRRLNRLYAVLSETNQAIVRAADQDSLFQDICRVAVEHGGFRMTWIGLVDEESGLVKPVAWSGVNEGYLENVRITVNVEPEGLGPTGSAIREGTLSISGDILNDPLTAPWHEEAEKRGYRSSASISLKLNGVTIGALTMYAGEKDFFRWQLSGLLQQMATDISFALDNLDREARRREAERALQVETLERLRAMEALREKDQLLMQQSRLAALGEMISNIAHQWRQPLNTLGLLVQELPVIYELGGFSKDYLESRVEKAKEVIFHMSQTIDDFRNYFRPDKEKTSFRVSQVVDKTLSLIDGSFKSMEIEVEVIATGNPVINGYPNEYSQVLLNILINARDAFVERKTNKPRVIAINTYTENNKAIVNISDNAGGISEDIMDKIFDPYFTTKGPDKGTGVGLFMAKTIIAKNMNGRLMVRNTGTGAEFRIEV